MNEVDPPAGPQPYQVGPTFGSIDYGPQAQHPDTNYLYPQGGLVPQRRTSKKWWFAGIAAVVVVVLVIGGVLVWQLRSSSDGASSPENAALDALAAVESRDPLAFTETIAAGELDGLSDVLTSTSDKAEETGFQDGGGVSGLLQGLSVATDDVHTEVEEIRDDLAKVTFTSGSATVAVDPDEVNVGFRDLISKDATAEEETIDISDLTGETENGDPIAPFVMTVKIDGRWYLSPLYTAGEYATVALDERRIDDPDVDTQEYGTPEEAAEGFLRAVADTVERRDVSDLSGAMSSHIGRAIATYQPLFDRLLDANELDDDVSIDIDRAEFTSETSGSSAKVVADNLDMTVTTNGDSYKVEVSGDCVDTTGPDGEREHNCGDDEGIGVLGFFFSLGREGGGVPEGISATRDGSGWHIDPVATLVTGAFDSLDGLTTDQLLFLIGVEGGGIEVYSRAEAEGTLEVGASKSVTLSSPLDTSERHAYGVAVLDMDVERGKTVRIEVNTDDYAQVDLVGASGRLDRDYDYEGDNRTYEFQPDETETVKVVVTGYDDERVTLKVR
ncbi:hypothetical protein [Antrihabitans sp. YC2-6]|uniref:hypothetical protein n=1 Tax=Antrihabitans sp. YC2-6 TaxID=2799498 RepID=UPI0018F7773A|nr:hypothetical protein [Antrihabitans sp. YC2-6]MBJ8347624.1 hypothetical protein [Antrihabitans sp. YC2-6]